MAYNVFEEMGPTSLQGPNIRSPIQSLFVGFTVAFPKVLIDTILPKSRLTIDLSGTGNKVDKSESVPGESWIL